MFVFGVCLAGITLEGGAQVLLEDLEFAAQSDLLEEVIAQRCGAVASGVLPDPCGEAVGGMEGLCSFLHQDLISSVRSTAGRTLSLLADELGQVLTPRTRALIQYWEGEWWFGRRRWEEALAVWHGLAGEFLPKHIYYDYMFKRAYSLFKIDSLDEALLVFEMLAGEKTPYQDNANFFAGYIYYRLGVWQKAVEYFSRVEVVSAFEKYVPFYIAQALFMEGKTKNTYARFIDYALRALKNPAIHYKYRRELVRLLAYAYLAEGNAEEAANYMEQYLRARGTIGTPEDIFTLGYLSYRLGRFERARDYLSRVSVARSLPDTLKDFAMYLIGVTDIKLGRMNEAATSLYQLSRTTSISEVRKNAFFNALAAAIKEKLYHRAVNMARWGLDSLTVLTGSERALLEQTLATLLLALKDYQTGLKVLAKLRTRSPALIDAYLRLSYNEAVRLINEGRCQEATAYLDSCIANPLNSVITASAFFWKGECAYWREQWSEAIRWLSQFVQISDIVPDTLFPVHMGVAYYTMAYAYYRMGKLLEAQRRFEDAASTLMDSQLPQASPLAMEALLRAGDIAFNRREFPRAWNNYEKALALGVEPADYPLAQLATIAFLNGDLGSLRQYARAMEERYPESPYRFTCDYLVGRALLDRQQYDEAERHFSKLITTDNPHRLEALAHMALLKLRMKDYQQAVEYARRVLRETRSGVVAQLAMSVSKSAYIALGDPEGYVDFVKEVTGAEVGHLQRDSVTFAAAEWYVEQGDCDGAVKALNTYLESFENGLFVTDARVLRAECLLSLKQYDKAFRDYEWIAYHAEPSVALEGARTAASIAEKHLKDTSAAYALYWRALELASASQLRTELLGNVVRLGTGKDMSRRFLEAALELASSSYPGSTQHLQALRAVALYYYGQQMPDSAYLWFDSVRALTQLEPGVEARYYMAQIMHLQGKYDSSIAMCLEIAEHVPAYEKWIVRAYLLIAQNLIAKQDYYQARATLKSLIDNYPEEDEVKARAKELLAEVERKLASQTHLPGVADTLPLPSEKQPPPKANEER